MAGQTQVERVDGGNGRTIAGKLRYQLGELAHDILSLVELQVELLAEDSRDVGQRARLWAMVFGGACLFALGSLPVAILGIAYLVAWTGLDLGLCMLLVALALMTVSGVVGMVSWRYLKTAAEPLQRSRRELKRNLDWIKRTLAD